MAVAMTAAFALAAGCGGGDQGTSASTSSSTSPSTTSTTSTSSTTTTTTTTSPARTAATLRRALLALKDLPAGFEIDKDGADEEGDETITSTRPGCKALVRLLNADELPGSLAAADVAFSGGADGPFIEETLDGFGSADAAKGFVGGFRTAVTSCSALTYTVPGIGRSTLKVREVSFADLGDDSFAARFTADSGALEGFELIQVAAQTGDVVLGMTCVQTDPSDAEAATEDALAKVEATLGTSRDA